MTLDTSQPGRAGELAFTLCSLITSDGQVGAIRGGPPVIGLQVKTGDHIDKSGQDREDKF
jgi:hypothetical protein